MDLKTRKENLKLHYMPRSEIFRGEFLEWKTLFPQRKIKRKTWGDSRMNPKINSLNYKTHSFSPKVFSANIHASVEHIRKVF